MTFRSQRIMKVSNLELFYLKSECDSTHSTVNRELETVNFHIKIGTVRYASLRS